MESEIKKIHHDLICGIRSCHDLVHEKLSLLEKNEHATVNLLLKDYALSLAEQKDRKIAAGEPFGLLEGIPFGIKDVILLQNTVATCGSSFLQNYLSPYTATAVQKLIDEGAIPVVKENCDSFSHSNSIEIHAFGASGPVYGSDKVTRGSMGSAVNVAKQFTVFSIGDDTGGSILQASGFNKIYGLKPTFGSVSRYGCMTSSTGCIGPFATSLEDIRIIINAISGKDKKDNSTCSSKPIPETVFSPDYPAKNITVGYFTNFIANENPYMTVQNDFQKMIDRLSSNGIHIKPLDFFDVNVLVSTYYALAMAETASDLAKLDGTVYGSRSTSHPSQNAKDAYMTTRSENFTDETKRRIIAGNQLLSQGYHRDIYIKAQTLAHSMIKRMNEVFDNVDIVLSPNSHDAFTTWTSLGGYPALTVPFFTPSGIQIAANKHKEDLILNFAHALKDKQP
ncbi:MAG: hypothetical protein LBE79_07565 [Tannerella sp.]|jgi:aspartyl-tRNA(Asn)/glutamyl-tRNA(Gln) amidotransferase subunit A|nr:hypothetical protein [Tannerella sp.]